MKCVLDARHLNSNTKQSNETWPIEHLACQLALPKTKYKCTLKITIHKTDIALHLDIDSVMTRVLLLHNTLDHDMTT